MKKLKILGIIPARGGSKSVPRKNIKKLAGKPLLSYVLSAAKKSRFLIDLVVSSDDADILRVAEKYGGEEAVLKRPKELAKDETSDVPVLQHAVELMEIKKKISYDIVVMLHATTPLLRTEDIDGCIEKLIKTDADSVVSVYKVTDANPIKMKRIVDDKLLPYVDGFNEDTTIRRQDLPPVYRRNAGIYVSKRKIIMEDGKVWGKDVRPYLMPEERSVDINGLLDFYFAEAAIKFLKKEKNEKPN
ncbi:MAG TPA: acylneuraminate cytidylyltransferase family protein [Candidatus Paceibacterota bacterium]